MSAFSGLPNVGSLIPSIDNAFINFEEIPVGRKTCDVCGEYFSITGDLQDCPVGLPCRHVHCFGCTWTWLHRNHSCPECDTKYVIQPICVALKHEAYLCRYQGFPPSSQSQLEPLPSTDHVGDFMDPDDNDATIANPSSPGIEELSEEYICLNIGPRTEEREGGARTTHLLTESKDGIFRSSTNTSTQELGAEVLPEQSRTDQGRPVDWQAVYEQRLHKSKDPKRLAKYYKMPFAETDSQRAETDSQRAERLNKKREHHRKYVANQTEEERAKRLDNARRRGIRRRAAETEDEREKRLALAKKKKAEKRDTK